MAVFIDLTLGLTRATVLVFKGIENGEERGDPHVSAPGRSQRATGFGSSSRARSTIASTVYSSSNSNRTYKHSSTQYTHAGSLTHYRIHIAVRVPFH